MSCEAIADLRVNLRHKQLSFGYTIQYVVEYDNNCCVLKCGELQAVCDVDAMLSKYIIAVTVVTEALEQCNRNYSFHIFNVSIIDVCNVTV